MEYKINYKLDEEIQSKLSLREVLMIEVMKTVNVSFEMHYPVKEMVEFSKRIHRFIKSKEPLMGSAEAFGAFYLLNAKSRKELSMEDLYEAFWVRTQHHAWMPTDQLILSPEEIIQYVAQPSQKFRVIREDVYRPSVTKRSPVETQYRIKLKRIGS